MNDLRILDGEIILKLKETVSYALDMVQTALPALPVGAWIVVMGLCFGIAANVYAKVRS